MHRGFFALAFLKHGRESSTTDVFGVENISYYLTYQQRCILRNPVPFVRALCARQLHVERKTLVAHRALLGCLALRVTAPFIERRGSPLGASANLSLSGH